MSKGKKKNKYSADVQCQLDLVVSQYQCPARREVIKISNRKMWGGYEGSESKVSKLDFTLHRHDAGDITITESPFLLLG